MFRQKKFFNNKGFTLMELLVVIAIIGVLAATVFVSLSTSRDKSQRSSALASLRSAMPVLLDCADADGYGYNDDASMAGKYVCQNTGSGNNQKTGYPATWPTLLNGWTYQTATGELTTNNYSYTAVRSGQTTITCTLNGAKCN